MAHCPFGPRRCIAFVLSVMLLPLCGCSGGLGALHPVQGKVTVDGKPLTNGSVAFHPDEAKGNTGKKVASGEIEDGAYKLYTDGKSGAPAGWYKVAVTAATEVDSDKAEEAKSLVGVKFTDPKETPLTIEVTAAPAAGAYDLKVSAK